MAQLADVQAREPQSLGGRALLLYGGGEPSDGPAHEPVSLGGQQDGVLEVEARQPVLVAHDPARVAAPGLVERDAGQPGGQVPLGGEHVHRVLGRPREAAELAGGRVGDGGGRPGVQDAEPDPLRARQRGVLCDHHVGRHRDPPADLDLVLDAGVADAEVAQLGAAHDAELAP